MANSIQDTNGLGLKAEQGQSMRGKKMINIEQCPILWHMENLKISHVDNQRSKQ